MQIEINEDLISFLQAQAEGDNVSPEIWVQRKIEATLSSLLKSNLVNRISSKKFTDILTIDIAVKSIENVIKERDKPEGSEEVVTEDIIK